MPDESVVVIVVPRDRFSMFPQCLDALYARTHVPFRVIVVAGSVDSATREYLCAVQRSNDNTEVLLTDHLVEQGEARNLALKDADERFVVVLENDTIVHDNWLPPMFKCMREEGAAVVTPLLWWYRGLHAAGGSYEEGKQNGTTRLTHTINYSEIRRRRIDYPENHCILIDRRQLPGNEIFDEVEPFDVDLGLSLRRRGLNAFLEPRAAATYSAPPTLELRDIPPFKLRWDWPSWEARNRRFEQKWRLSYDRSEKRASYRRQKLKLGLAGRYPNELNVRIANLAFSLSNRIQSVHTRLRLARSGITYPTSPHAGR